MADVLIRPHRGSDREALALAERPTNGVAPWRGPAAVETGATTTAARAFYAAAGYADEDVRLTKALA